MQTNPANAMPNAMPKSMPEASPNGPPNAMPSVPRFAMIGLVLATLATVAAVRITGIGAIEVPVADAIDRIELRFEDRADGSIGILEAGSGRLVDTVAPGTNGFLRGTMRGLARERKRQGFGPETPFSLVGRADGRLTLEDPTTGRRIDLGSFGPANAAVFARLLVPHGQPASAAAAVRVPADADDTRSTPVTLAASPREASRGVSR